MAELKKLLEDAGFQNVRTLLASGNVVFESKEINTKKLTEQLDTLMTERFGFVIQNIVRKLVEIKEIVASDPFKNIPETPMKRYYVTFLKDESDLNMKIPLGNQDGGFVIHSISDKEIMSYKVVAENSGTTDAMKILTEKCGKNITTRNWNTVRKISLLD